MKIFLAGIESIEKPNIDLVDDGYNLGSFYSINKTAQEISKRSKEFLLDSGAFTFMSGTKGDIDWDEYIYKYAEFININNIDLFFELDIDNIVGYKKVLEYRKKLEYLTNKKCIPVWHKSRGIKDFQKMCDEYDYVSIGGIITKEIKKSQYDGFSLLIAEAHRKKTKIHGLGFTSINLLRKYHFDSIDSTNWTFGRYGHYWVYKNGHIKMMHRPYQKKCADRKGLQKHNIIEWTKFQKYAENNL